MGDHERDDSVTMGTLQESIKTINEQVQQQRKYERNKVGIFWDWENIAIPKPGNGNASVPALLKNMRTDLLDYGKEIKQSRIYHDSSKAHSIVKHHRRSIANQGWEIVDCPCVKFRPRAKDKDKQTDKQTEKESTEGLNVKEVVDKKIIVDIMEFAYDHYEEGATVVIISNDADYGYMLSRLRGKGVYVVVVYSILQHAEELLQVGDKAVHLSNFFEPDNASDRIAEETAADLIDDFDGDDEETESEAGSVQDLPGYLYPLLKEIENVSRTHQHSLSLCPGKALFSEVGNRLKEYHGSSRENMWKEMRKKAWREKLIEHSWLRRVGADSYSWRSGSDSEYLYTETKDPNAANIQKQLYFLSLTREGRKYLDEARPQDDYALFVG